MNGKRLYLRLLHYVTPYWRIFVLVILAIVVMAMTDPALAALIQPLLDGGFVSKDAATMKLMPFLLMSLVFVKGITMLASSAGMTWIAGRVVTDLRMEMFDKILTLPTQDFDNTSSGVLLSKVTYDVSRVMSSATEALLVLIRDSLVVMGLLVWMFYLNWTLSLIVFSTVPFVIIVIRAISRRLRHINLSIQDTMGDMTRILEEAINGHKLVKVFEGQHYEKTRFQAICHQLRKFEVKNQLTSGLSMLVIQLLTASALAVIIYIAALESVTGQITVGGFVSLFTAMGMLFSPVKHLTKVNEQLQQGLAAAESIFALIDRPSEEEILAPIAENPCHPFTRGTRFKGKLSFQQVTFTYPGQTQATLREVSLTVMPGETVALVGTSGSGKTTLVHLIPRFYTITQGGLWIDDIHVNEIPLSLLRANFSLVSQEIVLFNDTVAANIAYGSLAKASREQIIAVAEAAYVTEFIHQMPKGFDTIIGERGMKLSGGQRQRLAIARALLKDAPILIFDEATSSLDTQSEHQVQQSLKELKRGRTTLIIAHRLSTIVHADRIIVMDKGHVVEVGLHAELLGKQGIYAKLYKREERENI